MQERQACPSPPQWLRTSTQEARNAERKGPFGTHTHTRTVNVSSLYDDRAQLVNYDRRRGNLRDGRFQRSHARKHARKHGGTDGRTDAQHTKPEHLTLHVGEYTTRARNGTPSRTKSPRESVDEVHRQPRRWGPLPRYETKRTGGESTSRPHTRPRRCSW